MDWFQSQLDKGKCLILLDGFDEVADPKLRQKVGRWIENQKNQPGRNRFVLTSRPAGYRNHPIAGFTVLEVQPFTNKQVRRFVENWYLANETMAHGGKEDAGIRINAHKGACDLLGRLHHGASSTLAALSVNPLLLTMVATVHRYRSSLPGRRVELYAEICEVFLGKRQQALGVEEWLTPAQRKSVLQPLAYKMMLTARREINTDEAMTIIDPVLKRVGWTKDGKDVFAFLRDVESRSGLLLERESGSWGFAHLSFQEYLAATHILETKDTNIAAQLAHRIDDSWWHETLRLYAAQTDGSEIVLACLADQPITLPRLLLAQEIEEEAKELQESLRERVQRIIEEGLEDTDQERFHLAAESLLTRRLIHLDQIDDDRFIDPSLITNAEYQLFLDERAANLQFHQPDHWTALRFTQGAARQPIVGVRCSDAKAFCDWLTARSDGQWRFRPPTLEEGSEHALCGAYHQPVRWWSDEKISSSLSPKEWSATGLSLSSMPLRNVLASAREPKHGEIGADWPLTQTNTITILIDFIRALDRDRALDRALDRDRARRITYFISWLMQERTALYLIIKNNKNGSLDDCRKISDLLYRWLIAMEVMIHLALPYETQSPTVLDRIRSAISAMTNKSDNSLEKMKSESHDRIIELHIVRERLNGNLKPFEGIRIVRERVKKEDAS